MKIAISSIDNNIESDVSDIFGRCPYFTVVQMKDDKIEKTEFIKNENINQNSGAGVSVAKLMADENVNAVITGNVGPRALDILKQFNIEVYSGKGIIKNIIEEFINGKLEKIN